MTSLHTITQDLKAARTAAGLTQADVASIMGITQPAVAKIENSDPDSVSFNQITQYARALNLNLDVELNGNAHGMLVVRTELLSRPPRGSRYGTPAAVTTTNRTWAAATPTVLSFPANGTSQHFRIHGPSGAGKSVAVASLIEQLSESANVIVVSNTPDELKAYLGCAQLPQNVAITDGDQLDDADALAVARALVDERPIVLIHDGVEHGTTAFVRSMLGSRSPELVVTTTQTGQNKATAAGSLSPDVELSIAYDRQTVGHVYAIEQRPGQKGLPALRDLVDSALQYGPQMISVDRGDFSRAADMFKEASPERELVALNGTHPMAWPEEVKRLTTFDNALNSLAPLDTKYETTRELLANYDLTQISQVQAVTRALAEKSGGDPVIDELARAVEDITSNLDGVATGTLHMLHAALVANLPTFAGRGLILQTPHVPEPVGYWNGLTRTARSLNVAVVLIPDS